MIPDAGQTALNYKGIGGDFGWTAGQPDIPVSMVICIVVNLTAAMMIAILGNEACKTSSTFCLPLKDIQ